MHLKRFSNREALLFGWDTFKRNLRLIVGIVIIAIVIDLFLTGLASSLTEESPLVLRTGISIIYWIVSALIEVGLVKISLDYMKNNNPLILMGSI
ncbi:MAG TPA: hypothetical protein VN455_02870 [Methanotrichaceae archaeon]|nr:hypothetical protein [Methanotrichaceae archaeon]